ncbi:carbohydrate ABC transporter permease [Kineococcus rubinsiae]|uniref:carbohydrate ABC transporter permease n=1 Tax=Kineococcus rubinsiae TaxID=2609562 RepID=UPI001AD8F475|nr:carbohydrate ABC transporter permease [Kineococcus rubinsiae]
MSTTGTRPRTSGAPAPAATVPERRRRRSRGRRFVLVAVLALVWVFPLYWMVVTALSPREDLAAGDVGLVPTTLDGGGFHRALVDFPVLQWTANSAAIAVVAVVITVVVDVLAGYVLAKHRFPGRSVVFFLIIATLMIPIQVLLVPQFDLVAQLGWLNSYWAVIIPRSAEAFGVFLARQYFLSMPDELLEAAQLDGAGQLRTLWSVVLPLSRPLVAVLVVMTFMYRWNEFAWPLVALRDPALYTLPVGLSFLQGQYTTDYPALMAGALVSILPVLVLFAVAQRQFVAGIARSGLK